ncbi:MAG: phospholipase D family protein [Alphaproteobacteria bacterium]|nr:phospholipase D family protein [Alphaproteobacteria bacterium]
MSKAILSSPVAKACGVFLIAALLARPALASRVQDIARAFQGGGAQSVALPASVEIAFSPGGGSTDLVIKAIETAKSSVLVAAYSFTSKPIARALISARKNGVNVAVVVDHGQLEKSSHSVIDTLAAGEIPVRADTVHALQHDKYMVIDGKTVETGSFNYTAAAEARNSENVIVLWNSPELAKLYGENWQSLWDEAEPYKQPSSPKP